MDTQMVNKRRKSHPTPLASGETQVKSTVRFHHTSIRTAKTRVVTTPNAGEDVEKVDHSHIASGNVKNVK